MEKLEELTLKRWKFLQLLELDEINEFHDKLVNYADLSESVMENSSKDRVSHFCLRLCISKTFDYSTRTKFIEKESMLFSYRLQQLSKTDVTKSTRDVLRHLDEHTSSDINNEVFEVLTKALHHILDQDMLDENCDHEFEVPFYIVDKLVAKRKVILQNGQALIKGENVKEFLSCVFSSMLRSSIKQMTSTRISYGFEEDDDRMLKLVQRIQCQIVTVHEYPETKTIKFENINEVSKHFPPCFAHVHQKLQTSHRLGHHARVAYTLFLKDIGLPLEESLKFWSHFYSKNSYNHQKCTHSWQENSKKFEYSINHLYGNAGNRKSYSAHNCQSIAQRCSNLNDELNCPFYDIEDSVDHRKSCFQSLKKPSSDISLISSPKQYFQLSQS